MTDVKMSGPLARASPPVKLPWKMVMKTRPSKRVSPPSRTGSLHINTVLVAFKTPCWHEKEAKL